MNTLRLRNAVKGAKICFNGNEEDYQRAHTAQGLPLSQTILNYILLYPFRWHIAVEFTFKFNELVKSVSVDFKTGQALMLNELSETVLAEQTKAALELGDSWKFSKKTWVARIL